jgi:methylase of polypeptide subunit release factors
MRHRLLDAMCAIMIRWPRWTAARTGWTPIASLAAESAPFLAPDGAIAVEIGHDQAGDVTNLFETADLRKIGERSDYGGHIGHFFL